MRKRSLITPSVTGKVHCRKCGTDHIVHIMEIAGELAYTPQICTKCGVKLPAPPSPLFDAYRRQQHPFKKH